MLKNYKLEDRINIIITPKLKIFSQPILISSLKLLKYLCYKWFVRVRKNIFGHLYIYMLSYMWREIYKKEK